MTPETQDLTQQNLPATITDNVAFKSLVNAWTYADVWDSFDVIYDDKRDVPARLHNYTIVRSDDPQEPFGALLQMTPCSATGQTGTGLLGKKLLAKVRLA